MKASDAKRGCRRKYQGDRQVLDEMKPLISEVLTVTPCRCMSAAIAAATSIVTASFVRRQLVAACVVYLLRLPWETSTTVPASVMPARASPLAAPSFKKVTVKRGQVEASKSALIPSASERPK